jgi:hypothetical protein
MAASASVSAADVYKWTDASGRVHYGDQPKQGAQKVNVGSANGESATPEDKDAASQKKQHAEDCGRKRDQLTNYQKATRIVEKDALGNEKEYNEADRQKLISVTQKQITEGCADVPAAPDDKNAPK